MIHVLNKNEVAIKNTDYYNLIRERSNVILLGDSLGDAKMADGIDHAENVLKIGFIFEQVKHLIFYDILQRLINCFRLKATYQLI